MKCPACQTALKEDAKFCFKCGQRIPRCPTCGEPVLTRSKFCGKDGTALPQEVLDLLPGDSCQTVPAPGAVRQPVAPEVKKAQAKPEEPVRATHSCARCGAPCPEGRRYCAACAAKMRQQAAKKYCAKCGNVVTDGQQLCSSCRPKEPEHHADRYERRGKSGGKGNTLIILLVVATAIICLLTAAACYVAITGSLPFGDSKAEENETVAPPTTGWFEYYDEEFGVNVLGTEPEETEMIETQAPSEPPTEPPTEAPTEPEIDGDPRVLYFIENCDSMYLSASDVEGFDEEMCRIARNSIYAKSGRMFKDASLQDYFEQFDWYDPWVSPSDFTGDMLNQYQSANLNMIMNYEREHGYR